MDGVNPYGALPSAADPAGTVYRNWPGLINTEWALRVASPQFRPADGGFVYWAGIDCNGLVLHSLRYAERPATYAAGQLMTAYGHVAPEGISIAHIGGRDIHTDAALDDINSAMMFSQAVAGNAIYLFQHTGPNHRNKRLLHKGDIIRYPGHISIVRSDRLTITNPNVPAIDEYQIVHACGFDEWCYDNRIPDCQFSRKVVITDINNHIQGLRRKRLRWGHNLDHAYGRIKLWREN